MLDTSFSPITTTSPLLPQLCTIQYPSLMTQHQISQCYHPSLGSMFHLPSRVSHSTPPDDSNPVTCNLRAVSFPRDCLSWFTSIASINTAQNCETCGLLLGIDKGVRYVVTTLLIPKQHATSDTCVIDKEDLVMQFTEGRSLIILGWVCRHVRWWLGALCSLARYCQIHTHPTQSCTYFLEMHRRAIT